MSGEMALPGYPGTRGYVYRVPLPGYPGYPPACSRARVPGVVSTDRFPGHQQAGGSIQGPVCIPGYAYRVHRVPGYPGYPGTPGGIPVFVATTNN
eukprot:1538314-Rhodomonas_salina.1